MSHKLNRYTFTLKRAASPIQLLKLTLSQVLCRIITKSILEGQIQIDIS